MPQDATMPTRRQSTVQVGNHKVCYYATRHGDDAYWKCRMCGESRWSMNAFHDFPCDGQESPEDPLEREPEPAIIPSDTAAIDPPWWTYK